MKLWNTETGELDLPRASLRVVASRPVGIPSFPPETGTVAPYAFPPAEPFVDGRRGASASP